MKFLVDYEERVYYLATEVEASSRAEAEDRFLELLELGMVPDTESEVLRLEAIPVQEQKKASV